MVSKRQKRVLKSGLTTPNPNVFVCSQEGPYGVTEETVVFKMMENATNVKRKSPGRLFSWCLPSQGMASSNTQIAWISCCTWGLKSKGYFCLCWSRRRTLLEAPDLNFKSHLLHFLSHWIGVVNTQRYSPSLASGVSCPWWVPFSPLGLHFLIMKQTGEEELD